MTPSEFGARFAKQAVKSQDIVDRGVGGALADYVAAPTFGSSRAGRASQMARASGDEPGSLVDYPLTTDALGAVGGGLVGLGGLAGASLLSSDPNRQIGRGVGGATLAAGSLLGMLLARHMRHKKINDISDRFDQASSEGRTSNPKPSIGALSSVLLPLGGPHRAGQADAYEAIRDDKPVENSPGRSALYGASTAGDIAQMAGAPNPISTLIGIPQGMQQGLNARRRVNAA